MSGNSSRRPAESSAPADGPSPIAKPSRVTGRGLSRFESAREPWGQNRSGRAISPAGGFRGPAGAPAGSTVRRDPQFTHTAQTPAKRPGRKRGTARRTAAVRASSGRPNAAGMGAYNVHYVNLERWRTWKKGGRRQSFPRRLSHRSRQTRHTASRTIFRDILLSPMSRSTNMIGISPIRKARLQARKLISIWNA
jgi:hypothetical protein